MTSAVDAMTGIDRTAMAPRSDAAGEESQNEGARIENEVEDGVGDVGAASAYASTFDQRARLFDDLSCDAAEALRDCVVFADDSGEALRWEGLACSVI